MKFKDIKVGRQFIHNNKKYLKCSDRYAQEQFAVDINSAIVEKIVPNADCAVPIEFKDVDYKEKFIHQGYFCIKLPLHYKIIAFTGHQIVKIPVNTKIIDKDDYLHIPDNTYVSLI